jgi:hypothetical protein
MPFEPSNAVCWFDDPNVGGLSWGGHSRSIPIDVEFGNEIKRRLRFLFTSRDSLQALFNSSGEMINWLVWMSKWITQARQTSNAAAI